MPDTSRPTLALDLFAAFGTSFTLIHGPMDQWFQPAWAAMNKRLYGQHMVYRDGRPAEGLTAEELGWVHAVTATQLGRRACTLHVAIYTVGQTAAMAAVTRVAGYRLPLPALAVFAAVNAATHWPLDRGALLRKLADWTGHTDYLNNATVVRAPGGDADPHGPGTGWYALDQTAHHGLAWAASLVATWVALKWGRK